MGEHLTFWRRAWATWTNLLETLMWVAGVVLVAFVAASIVMLSIAGLMKLANVVLGVDSEHTQDFSLVAAAVSIIAFIMVIVLKARRARAAIENTPRHAP